MTIITWIGVKWFNFICKASIWIIICLKILQLMIIDNSDS